MGLGILYLVSEGGCLTAMTPLPGGQSNDATVY
jgi:hypothetical protein